MINDTKLGDSFSILRRNLDRIYVTRHLNRLRKTLILIGVKHHSLRSFALTNGFTPKVCTKPWVKTSAHLRGRVNAVSGWVEVSGDTLNFARLYFCIHNRVLRNFGIFCRFSQPLSHEYDDFRTFSTGYNYKDVDITCGEDKEMYDTLLNERLKFVIFAASMAISYSSNTARSSLNGKLLRGAVCLLVNEEFEYGAKKPSCNIIMLKASS